MEGRTRLRKISELLAVTLAACTMCSVAATSARGEAMGRSALDLVRPEPIAAASPITVLPPAAGTLTATKATDLATPATPKADKPPEKLPEKTHDVAPDKVATVAPATQTAEPTSRPSEATSAIEKTAIRPAGKTEDTPAAKDGKSDQRSTGMMGGLYSALQVGGALAIVLGLILIGRAIMRKFVPGAAVSSGKGVMETLARYPIGRNQTVVLLRIGSQIVALNQTKDASQSILVVSEPVEVARIIGQIEGQDPKSIQATFSHTLANARMDLETPDTIDVLEANRNLATQDEDLDAQLEEMAAAKRQLMELRAQVRSVRDHLPT